MICGIAARTGAEGFELRLVGAVVLGLVLVIVLTGFLLR
jgi:hypothetical protein